MNAQLTVLFAGAALLVAGCGGTTLGRAATPSAAAPSAEARSEGLKPSFDPTGPYYHINMAPPVPLPTGSGWLLYAGPSPDKPQLIEEITQTEGAATITTRREVVLEWIQIPGVKAVPSTPGSNEINAPVSMSSFDHGPWHLRGHSDPGSKLLPLHGSGRIQVSPPANNPVVFTFYLKVTIPDNDHDYLLVPVIQRQFVRTTVFRSAPTDNERSAAAAVTSTSRIEQLHTVGKWFWQTQYTDSVYHDVSSQVFRRKR